MEPDALNIEAKTPLGQDLVGSLKRLPDGTILYAALTLARDLVIDEFVQVVRDLIGDASATAMSNPPSVPQPATASTRSLNPKPDTLPPIARLSPSEAESLRSEMQRSSDWMREELKRG